MRKLLLIVAALMVHHLLYAQNSKEVSTLYAYGKPLVTCESNLENLFSNMKKYISDDSPIELLSYKPVGVVKDAKHALKLVKENFAHYPKWAVAEQSQSYTESSKGKQFDGISSVKLTPIPEFPPAMKMKEVMKTIAKEFIQPGDSIYLVRFIFNLETFEQYTFISPSTREVRKGDLFGFDVRMSHFAYCNRKEKK